MPRKPRNFYLSDFYHIMVQGDEKKYIFSKDHFKDKYIYLLKRNSFRNDIRIIAYCIMDNHAHILLHCIDINKISKTMAQCNTSYGMFYSKERKNVGHVFRDRYKSEAIYDENYLINCIKYIHENPVKAGIVKKCDDYLFSSFNEYINKTNPLYCEMIECCDFGENEYCDIIKNSHTEIEYIDDIEKEEIEFVFNEIEDKYNINNLNNNDIKEIYKILYKRCKISKAKIADLLGINRRTFLNKIKEDI